MPTSAAVFAGCHWISAPGYAKIMLMLQHINGYIAHPGAWRRVTASEMDKLYISMLIRTLGINIIGIFVPVYLYQLGYDLWQISMFFVLTFAIRLVSDNIGIRVIGKYGPKHIMIVSQIFLILFLGMLLTLERYGWPLLPLAFLDALATGLFYAAYHIEFSKIQSAKDSGKEVSNMFIVGKLANALGPLIGGFIAQIFGVPIAVAVSLVFILSSSVPLVMSPEPVRRHQHITYKGFPWRSTWQDACANFALGFEQISALFIWPLFVSIFIFSENVYVNIGLVTSVGLISSLAVSRAYGKLIDRGRSTQLMGFGIFGQMAANFARPFIGNVTGAYIFNLVSDPLHIAMHMPALDGVYASASSYEGYRNAYIGLILTAVNVARMAGWLLIGIVAVTWSDKVALQSVFVVTALVLPLVSFQRLRK